MTTAASLVLHHQKLKKFELKYLMLEVGNLVSELTNYECENLYQNPIYVFEGKFGGREWGWRRGRVGACEKEAHFGSLC